MSLPDLESKSAERCGTSFLLVFITEFEWGNSLTFLKGLGKVIIIIEAKLLSNLVDR